MITSLSIVYPMYNERENITKAVEEALRVGKQITPHLEIIIVDDASTDGAGALADQLAIQYAEVHVEHHLTNRKLGGALKTGFAAARHEWILYLDSDLPIRMDDALQAVPLAEEADLVIGWRFSRAENWKREVMSFIYNRLIRYGFGLRVHDVNFSFKLFKRSLYENIHLTSEGSFIDAELLLEMQRLGAVTRELGLNYYPRQAGVSTLAGNRVVLKILLEMFKYWMRRHAGPTDHTRTERGRLRAEQGH